MNALQLRLLSLALFAVFCATLTYWIVTLSAQPRESAPVAAAVGGLPTEQAGTLFGGQLEHKLNETVHLFGILALREGAAAIVSTGDGPPHAVSLGGLVMDGTKLAEVRPHSIVIDHRGTRSEVFLPTNVAQPTIYMR